MIELPQLTLVMVETRQHELARMAVEDCLRVAAFGDVLILTDRPAEFAGLGRIRLVPDWPDKIGWSQAWWFDVPPLVTTSHTLNIQWDSWIWQPAMWRAEFLKFDYIGAPWPSAWFKKDKRFTVGNGGFSLVSTRLKQYVLEHREIFPCTTSADDALLCCEYRPALEAAGFVWAPEQIARDFAFECDRPGPRSNHFGFHGAFNFSIVLDQAQLQRRLAIVARSPYAAGKANG